MLVESLELLRLDDPGMLPVGQDASRLLLELSGELLRGVIAPASDTPRAYDVFLAKLDGATLKRRTALLIDATQVLEQAMNDTHFQRAQDNDAALADDRVGIQMADREIMQHLQGRLSTMARRMRLAPSVIGKSVCAARRSASS
jgi:hypothetical protein